MTLFALVIVAAVQPAVVVTPGLVGAGQGQTPVVVGRSEGRSGSDTSGGDVVVGFNAAVW